ncbi:ABC transporter permease [Barnesiella sp. An55]|uniref:ABC transporter permease n=1 Tax=Barnesiella sp. An55 TaxID=1965646 RepID=UPI000B3AAD6C|nr:ABC transporter permease [Barnesiella sp. An55]OUN73234.1 hypothetical protein B5G10_05420 [Barnesiella sp. An55]
MVLLYLLEKEFKQFFRDPGLPKMAIAFPVLMMLVFPFAVSMEIRNINLVVVDSNRSVASSKLIETCTASGYFNLVAVSDDPDWAMQQMDKNRADAILTIESDFDRCLERGEALPVGIKVNTINGTKGSIGAGYLTSCIQRYRAEASPASTASPTAGPQLDVSAKYYFNTYLDYKKFMVPALIVIAITMLTGFFPALNIVSEKERGTIEQINVTPVNRGVFILCKLIPYWLVAFFVLTACLLIARWVFDYSCAGSVGLMYFFTAGNILVTAGMGLLISNYSENAQQAMFVTWFFMMVFMLVSGIFTPIASMPDWAQAITYLNPMRYYADAMRGVYIKGSTLADVWSDAAGLLTIGTVMVAWVILSYKKTT